MVSLEKIEAEILDLEKHDTTYATVERLAWLYIVRDHLTATSSQSTGDICGCEFIEACSNKPLQEVMNIIAEHLEAIKILFPKEYSAIIQKVHEIKE